MMRTEDLTGRMFGRWLVLYQVKDYISKSGQRQPMWMCECQCEKHTKRAINGYSLKRGDSKSCGCYYNEIVGTYNKKYNSYILIDDKYYIGTTQSGKDFYFDKDDYDIVKNYCWSVDNSNGYVKTLVNNSKIYLHNLVMGFVSNKNVKIDHQNRHRNDCRKSNLKLATSCQNAMNVGFRSDNKSGIKGVSLDKRTGKYDARIKANKKMYRLGLFTDFTCAAFARLRKEEELFKDFMTDDNRKILEYLRNGGTLEYGNKNLINKIINNNVSINN